MDYCSELELYEFMNIYPVVDEEPCLVAVCFDINSPVKRNGKLLHRKDR